MEDIRPISPLSRYVYSRISRYKPIAGYPAILVGYPTNLQGNKLGILHLSVHVCAQKNIKLRDKIRDNIRSILLENCRGILGYFGRISY
jgi:hypothetical protein